MNITLPLIVTFMAAMSPGDTTPKKALEKVRYPKTQVSNHVDHYFGEAMSDPFRWLENMEDGQTKDWVKAQDALTRSTLESLPGRQALLKQMASYRKSEQRLCPPQHAANHFVFIRTGRENKKPFEALVLQHKKTGMQKVLAKSTQFGEGKIFAFQPGYGTPILQVSRNGRLAAFGIQENPAKWCSWYVIDLQSGKITPTGIKGINTSNWFQIAWLPDHSGFYFTAYDNPKQEGQLGQPAIFRYRLGSAGPPKKPVFSLPRDKEPVLFPRITSDGGVLAVQARVGSDWHLYARALDQPKADFTQVAPKSNTSCWLVDGAGGLLWLRANWQARGERLLSVPLANPTMSHARILVDERKGAVLSSAHFFGGRFLLNYTRGGAQEVWIASRQGQLLKEAQLPYLGWMNAGFQGTPHETAVSFNLQGTADSGSSFMLDITTGTCRPFANEDKQFTAQNYLSEQVFYTSKDGTSVPLFLMHRRDMIKSANTPVWLYAYGSGGWPARPWYQPEFRAWLEMGGVFALAHIRGGGEYGEQWTKSGSGIHKQNGIDDYIAAARWLHQNGYGSPAKTVANGGSASGPLAAAALNQAPQVFGAAVVGMPIMDVLRAHQFRKGRSAVFDQPDTREKFAALRAWSPYHNLQKGRCYPPVIVSHGYLDTMAVPLHSFKYIAALQAAQGCPRPTLLQIAWKRGHTVGGLEERANILAFLAWQLDLPIPNQWL